MYANGVITHEIPGFVAYFLAAGVFVGIDDGILMFSEDIYQMFTAYELACFLSVPKRCSYRI